MWSFLNYYFQEHQGKMEGLQRPQGWRGDTEETWDILRLSLYSPANDNLSQGCSHSFL